MEPEHLDFFGAFTATAQHPEVVELTQQGSEGSGHGKAFERDGAFAGERGQHAEDH